jgi:hypothetical protein
MPEPSRRAFLTSLAIAQIGMSTPEAQVPPVAGGSTMTAELKPLYRVRFTYPNGWSIPLAPGSLESQHFFFADGRCEGRISGRFRGANHPRRRGDGTYCPDFQGVIESDDGAVVYFDYQGYGRAYPEGRRQVVLAATHLASDERYRWLNDTVCVSTGEVRSATGRPTELVLDVAELVWKPIAE